DRFRPMTGFYGRWIDRWERRLAGRDTNRVVRPFEWGTEWLARIGFPSCPADANGGLSGPRGGLFGEGGGRFVPLFAYLTRLGGALCGRGRGRFGPVLRL